MKTETCEKVNNKVKLSRGFKRKWTDALRSGKYPQGTGLMYDPLEKTYDPIGVAYRVAGVPDKTIAKKIFPDGKTYRFLPMPLVNNEQFISKITDFNDRGLSFKWIASYIENNL
jgi:hypothetical protein